MAPVARRLLGTGIYALLWTTCLAAVVPRLASEVQFAKRGISKDPSCPNGWLCQQQKCDAACPSGEVCIEFEGTMACAPAGQTWCALNPSNLQAVQCQNDGVCCHGNCYKSGTVCCNNTAIQCAIGDLCLACPGDQPCTAGASTCAAGGASPTSQSPTTKQTSAFVTIGVPTTQPGETTAPTTKAPTTKAPTTEAPTTDAPTSKAPTTKASPTTSSIVASPSIIKPDGDFKYQGCFVDSVSSRALIVSNSTDASSTGMTVEKCIDLAQKQSLRYAGVEFKSQCFAGNTLHSDNKASDGDCNMVCAGATGEFCGGGNRIQVYEDTTWEDPTLDELTDVLLQYNSSLFELRTLTGQYQDLIQRWSDQQDGKKRRWLFGRQTQTITVTELRNGLSDIENRFPAVRAVLETAARKGGRIYQAGASRDATRPASQPNPFVDPPTLGNSQQAFDVPLEPLRNVQRNLEDDLASIASSTDSQTPLLRTARDLQDAGAAASAVGTITGTTLAAIAAGVGVFALIALVFLHLHPTGNRNDGGPTQGPTQGSPETTSPSKTQSAPATSTTTSSATASATPYFVVAADGISEGDFQAYTDKLGSTPEESIINDRFVLARVVSLNDTEVQDVRKSSLIASATKNKFPGSIFFDSNKVETSSRKMLGKRTAPPRESAAPGSTVPATDLRERDGLLGFQLGHLQSLSAKWFFEEDASLSEYVFEKDPGNGIWIYVIDDGVDFNHDEIFSIQKDPEILIGNSVPAVSHGTAVAAQALGENLGVASSAGLVSVAITGEAESETEQALIAAYNDIVAKGRQGKAVVNMSWGFPSAGRQGQDFWLAKAIRDFIDIGVVPVCGAGNSGHLSGEAGLVSSFVPVFYGTFIEALITVGAVNELGQRWESTQKCNAANTDSTCLSAYAMGADVMIADADTGWYKMTSGTSVAAPVISGLAAYLMAHPHAIIQARIFGGGLAGIAKAVAGIINDWSWSRFGGGGADWPNVAWNGVVVDPCALGDAPSSTHPETPDAIGTGPKLQTTEKPLASSPNCAAKKAKKQSRSTDLIDVATGREDDHLACHQPIDHAGLSGYDVATGLPNSLLHDVCNDGSKEVTIQISLNNTTLVALVSQTHPATDSAEACRSGIQTIIDACIVKENFFGGRYAQGNATYSISNDSSWTLSFPMVNYYHQSSFIFLHALHTKIFVSIPLRCGFTVNHVDFTLPNGGNVKGLGYFAEVTFVHTTA